MSFRMTRSRASAICGFCLHESSGSAPTALKTSASIMSQTLQYSTTRHRVDSIRRRQSVCRVLAAFFRRRMELISLMRCWCTIMRDRRRLTDRARTRSRQDRTPFFRSGFILSRASWYFTSATKRDTYTQCGTSFANANRLASRDIVRASINAKAMILAALFEARNSATTFIQFRTSSGRSASFRRSSLALRPLCSEVETICRAFCTKVLSKCCFLSNACWCRSSC
mmetsp:Transcript_149564/g.261388  ORF Transcript_149564/g.261388 Transcript_149564/m.261388 type:complete len:226 (-) Transcript_149564:1118-1795(-)